MVTIIKYNAGNVRSVLNALNRIGVEAQVTDDAALIKNADKVIFPGVGEASTAMAYLKEKKLDLLIKDLTQPFLGICLGMQLLCQQSEENDTACIGVFDEQVKRFPVNSKCPHMGWNECFETTSPLFQNFEPLDNVYFVHSYFVEEGKHTIAKTNHALTFSAALQKNNFYAVQFHPEKSAMVGQRILENFLKL